ncbi:Putative acyl-CoA synthase [Corynebacterium glyciniphilum AJ 3170]|uniref:Putative acyl-CoA synthase n=1 Tax=Corynebacterium glyciniphilum AJ 3170 TaxID=1404245 RepID=X5DNF1_9CORY|nr:class I adenylate-forming enzyme family protein [Corynebacterium glyciniphilum]AHW64683.1 Putative acyl-CoA synthase [Corynebacterium glyciniphilum AJ 3170]
MMTATELLSGPYEATTGTFSRVPLSAWGALCRTASRYPDKTAVSEDSGDGLTFGELLNQAETASANLWAIGARPGTRVGLLLDNSSGFLTALLAVNRIGATSVMLPGKFSDAELAGMIRTARIDVLIADDRRSIGNSVFPVPATVALSDLLASSGRPVPGAVTDPGAPAVHMFTSGTTGTPKRVVLTNRNIMHAVAAYEHALDLTADDSMVFGAALYHVTGVVAVALQCVYLGMTLHLQRRFDPVAFIRWAEEVEATYIHGSPTIFQLMVEHWPEDRPQLDSVRLLACGAANMPPGRIQRLTDRMPGASFRTVYGLTETTSPATVFPEDAASSPFIGSSGTPVPGVSVRIVDQRGTALGPDEVGEITLSGTNVSPGYLDADDQFMAVEELTTGDLGYLTEEGYLYVVDRLKNQINRGGEKIHPNSVENALCGLDGVEDACVVGIPDELYGEVPAALVVVGPGTDVGGLLGRLRGRIAKYAVPVRILAVDEIPRTVGMKTDRNAVRALLAGG